MAQLLVFTVLLCALDERYAICGMVAYVWFSTCLALSLSFSSTLTLTSSLSLSLYRRMRLCVSHFECKEEEEGKTIEMVVAFFDRLRLRSQRFLSNNEILFRHSYAHPTNHPVSQPISQRIRIWILSLLFTHLFIYLCCFAKFQHTNHLEWLCFPQRKDKINLNNWIVMGMMTRHIYIYICSENDMRV